MSSTSTPPIPARSGTRRAAAERAPAPKPSVSGRAPAAEPAVSRQTVVARRRRILLWVALLLVVVLAVFANRGPLQSYLDARSRVDKVTTELAELEEQKAELQSQLGRLTEAGHLETLAREQMTYARPGEDVYILTGPAGDAAPAANRAAAGDAAAPEDGTAATSGATAANAGGSERAQPGPLERLVSAFLGLF